MAKTRAKTDARGRTTPIVILRRAPIYTKQERIGAVTTMLEMGGMTKEAISAIRLQLNTNISTRTLANWMNTYKQEVLEARQSLSLAPAQPTTLESVRIAQSSIADDLMVIQRMIADSIRNNPAQVDEASLRDKMVSMGISIDKLKDWSTFDPAVRDAWKNYEAVCLPANLNPLALFNDYVQSLRQHILQNTK